MYKFIFFTLLIILSNCKLNPVNKSHGVSFLDQKTNKLIINNTNLNDTRKILGPPSTTGIFDNTIWIYIENVRSRGKLLHFGRNVTTANNVLVLKFNNYGILKEKNFFDKDQLNEIKFSDETTESISREGSFIYNFLTSLRHKINEPAKKKLKKKRKKN